MPQLAVICAGSLLGVKLSPEPFPVGKVEFLQLHPMTFVEFLMAVDHKKSLDHLPAPSFVAHIPAAVQSHLWDLLKVYFVTGGMPEVVLTILESKNSTCHRNKLRERHCQARWQSKRYAHPVQASRILLAPLRDLVVNRD